MHACVTPRPAPESALRLNLVCQQNVLRKRDQSQAEYEGRLEAAVQRRQEERTPVSPNPSCQPQGRRRFNAWKPSSSASPFHLFVSLSLPVNKVLYQDSRARALLGQKLNLSSSVSDPRGRSPLVAPDSIHTCSHPCLALVSCVLP